MYELIEATEITPAILIRHNEDGTDTFIPMVRGNADYEAYLNKDNPIEPTTFPHQPLVEG
jgi:hypothetical protein